MPRNFRARPGRTVILPQGLYAGPGATNMRLDPDAVVTLEDAALASHQRWINGRLRAEDLEEVTEATPTAPVFVPSADRPGRDATPKLGMTVGSPDGKDNAK